MSTTLDLSLPFNHRQLIDRWLQGRYLIQAKTQYLYRLSMMRFAYAFRHKSLLEVSREDCRKYFWHWHQQDLTLKPSTMALEKSNIAMFYTWLIDENLYQSDVLPTYRIRFPKNAEPSTQPFSDEELRRIDRVVGSPAIPVMEKAFYHIVRSSSLRLAEVLSLRRDAKQIDLKQRLLFLQKDQTKARRVHKLVPISPEAKRWLAEWLAIDMSSSPYVFHSRTGQPLAMSSAFAILAKLIGMAFPEGFPKGMRRYGSHQFRHTFATQWAERNCNPIALKYIMGWTSLKMIDRYVHVSPTLIKQAVREFEVRYGGKGEQHLGQQIEALQHQIQLLTEQMKAQHVAPRVPVPVA